MEEKHRRILDKHIVEIRRVLDPVGVLPYFIQESVMSDAEIAQIRAQTTREEKVDMLIDVLKRSSTRSFHVFVEALEKVQEHLACLLRRSEVEELQGEVCALKAMKTMNEKGDEIFNQARDLSKRNEELSEENGKLKSKCEQLEKQLEEAAELKSKYEQLKRQLGEATDTSARYPPEGTPDSVDGATSPADQSRFDFEVTVTSKREGKGSRPRAASAKIRRQLSIAKKEIEDDDKQIKDLLESAGEKSSNTPTATNSTDLPAKYVARDIVPSTMCFDAIFQPQLLTMMEEKHRKLLRTCKKELLKDLDVLRLLPHMVDVLDQTDEDEIKAEGTRVKQCEKLLEILPRKGPTAFTCLTKALLEVQPYLGDMLLQAID